MKSNVIKGYNYAFLATVAFSNVYLFSKAALNEIHIAQFGFYWFVIGFGLNIIYVTVTKIVKSFFPIQRKVLKLLILIGILEIFITATFFLSIQIIPDPAVTSFLGNLYPVFLALFGVLFLHEKFRTIEAFGAVVAIIGAFVISFNSDKSLESFFIPGAGVVLLNALLAATGSVIVKKHIKKIKPELWNVNRSFWLLIFSFGMVLFFKQSFSVPVSALKNIAIGAFLGPFASILLIYYSFKYIDASKSAIIQSLKGIFVLIGAFFMFQTFPLTHQILGGLLTVAGVLIMTLVQANIIGIKKRNLRG